MPGYCPIHGVFAGYWCPRCRGRKVEDLREDGKIDVSFQCYACPNFIIFNSEDPNRIPRTVDKVNECFKEIRGFYWDLMDNAKIPMNFVNSETRHDVDAPLTNEDKEYLTHLLHVNESIHQLLAPHFICEDFDGKVYDNYMVRYEEFNGYVEALKNTPDLAELNLGYYWDIMNVLFEAVKDCFDSYLKKVNKN